MWMNESEISKAMYKKCLYDDRQEYWEGITDSGWAFFYCREVKDRVEVRKHITDPDWLQEYYEYNA